MWENEDCFRERSTDNVAAKREKNVARQRSAVVSQAFAIALSCSSSYGYSSEKTIGCHVETPDFIDLDVYFYLPHAAGEEIIEYPRKRLATTKKAFDGQGFCCRRTAARAEKSRFGIKS